MSMQAQAERERQARVILGDSGTQVAEKFGEAAKTYTDNPTALHLRAMNMLYEGLKSNNAKIVIVPSTAVESMQLGGLAAGMAALTATLGQEAMQGAAPPPGPWSCPPPPVEGRGGISTRRERRLQGTASDGRDPNIYRSKSASGLSLERLMECACDRRQGEGLDSQPGTNDLGGSGGRLLDSGFPTPAELTNRTLSDAAFPTQDRSTMERNLGGLHCAQEVTLSK